MLIHVIAGLAGVMVVLAVLWDAFETIILPRRVTRNFRFARIFLRSLWQLWSAPARGRSHRTAMEGYLSLYGPLSLLLLLITWAVGLIVGFGILEWAMGSPVRVTAGTVSFSTDLYFSGTTFFTLGLGDVVPLPGAARAVTVIEAGLGFGFLALVISYLPIIYQAFSQREVNVSLLDERAGSPPTASSMIVRNCQASDSTLAELLREWERWSAQLLESHLSYPILAYFRSQHDNQSWLAAITAILDTCSLLLVSKEPGPVARQARLTFAIARHAAVDLTEVLGTPVASFSARLQPSELARMRQAFSNGGLALPPGAEIDRRLDELHRMYEPYVQALSHQLLMQLPPWVPEATAQDDWQSTPSEALPVLPLG